MNDREVTSTDYLQKFEKIAKGHEDKPKKASSDSYKTCAIHFLFTYKTLTLTDFVSATGHSLFDVISALFFVVILEILGIKCILLAN